MAVPSQAHQHWLCMCMWMMAPGGLDRYQHSTPAAAQHFQCLGLNPCLKLPPFTFADPLQELLEVLEGSTGRWPAPSGPRSMAAAEGATHLGGAHD